MVKAPQLTLAFALVMGLSACAPQPDPSAAAPMVSPQVQRIRRIMQTTTGDPAAGKPIFVDRCANCHELGGNAFNVGPNLTHYLRDPQHVDFLIHAIVDPRAELQDFHTASEIRMKDGRTLTGVILSDTDADPVTLVQTSGRITKISHTDIDAMHPILRSLMPEDLLSGLTDRQVADFFAYLMTAAPHPAK